MVEERWPEKRRLAEESDAYESHEGIHSFESEHERRPNHEVDSGRDDVTLDGRQRRNIDPPEGS